MYDSLQMELNTGDPLMKCFLCLLDEDIPHLADLFSPEIANQQVTSSGNTLLIKVSACFKFLL